MRIPMCSMLTDAIKAFNLRIGMPYSMQILLNDFAIRSFRETADKDYIAARMAYRARLIQPFLWSASGHRRRAVADSGRRVVFCPTRTVPEQRRPCSTTGRSRANSSRSRKVSQTHSDVRCSLEAALVKSLALPQTCYACMLR
ncbi:hypothetical protein CBM2629_A60060 [Cupriavidus taiwanensis]|nr:hypothetical protein CBM2629_A60060 [Cupriavidus taiwanensis]